MKHLSLLAARRMLAAGDDRPAEYEMLVSAPTKKAAIELLGSSQSEFHGYGYEVLREDTIAEMGTFPVGTVLGCRYVPGGSGPGSLRPWTDIVAESAARRAETQRGRAGE